MTVIGLASFIAFSIIGIHAAFALALIAGLLEFIPTLGPILSGSTRGRDGVPRLAQPGALGALRRDR